MFTAPPAPTIDAPLLDWALYYASLGWPVFPCNGKEPFLKNGLYIATTDEEQLVAWWMQWPECNIGAPMGHWGWALDEDPRGGGDATRADLERTYQSLPDTMRSLSGRGDGGGHSFWRIPSSGVRHKANLGEGIDVIAKGGYVILPPSIHPETKQPYRWEIGPDEILIADTPPWLAALIAPDEKQKSTHIASNTNGVSSQYARIRSAVFALQTYDDYDAWLHVGMALHASEMVWARQIWDEWSAQSTKYDLEQQETKWASFHADGAISMGTIFYQAKQAGWIDPLPSGPHLHVSTNGHATHPGWGTPHNNLEAIATEPWRNLLITKKNGDPTQNAANMALFLQHHAFWQRTENHLWWDAVRGTPMMGNQEIDDDTITTIAEWMGTVERMPVNQLRLLERCVLKQCRIHKRDLLQHWLNAIPPWDEVPRLNHWFPQVTGAEDSVYSQGVSRIIPLSMVARAMQPGCLYRYVVIIEGPEEAGKSSLVRSIATPEWYVELSTGLESKEAHIMLQGAWVAELAELDAMTRTEETRLKAFITLREDSYVPKFSNFRESTPRRCIFIGTTNEESYLKGQTGNTRFLPIEVGQVDIPAFEAMREQIFAEALLTWRLNPTHWWQLSDEFLQAAILEREKRRIINNYEQSLQEWLLIKRFTHEYFENNTRVQFTQGETNWPEIARWFLGIESPERWKDKSMQMQIAAALKAQKWKSVTVRKGSVTAKIWRYEGTYDVPF